MVTDDLMSFTLITVAASAQGVAELIELCSQLPRDLPAAVLVVAHIGRHPSALPALLTKLGSLVAVHPVDGEVIRTGTVYVAPPDRHMLVEGDHIQLTTGPKEHHTRPAADPLFCSAARYHGRRTVGVVLSGFLDDGTAGLRAIHAAGGLTVIRDPRSALVPDMPQAALQGVPIDHCVPLAKLASLLVALTACLSER